MPSSSLMTFSNQSAFMLRCFGVACLILAWISPSAALQCYSCRGLNFYDPNLCFQPVDGKTIIEECAKGDACERKFIRLDYYQSAIERGCSSNCRGRKYIWTDDFFVNCCSDSLCNASIKIHPSSVLVTVTLLALLVTRLRW